MEDSFILANYVHEQSGKPVTDEDIVIYPWVSSENHPYPDISLLERRGWDACYKLVFKDGTVKILIMWSRQMERVTHAIFIQCLDDMHFSPISPNTPDERPACPFVTSSRSTKLSVGGIQKLLSRAQALHLKLAASRGAG